MAKMRRALELGDSKFWGIGADEFVIVVGGGGASSPRVHFTV